MTRRRLIRFCYSMPPHKDRELAPFQMRDGEATMCLIEALADLGYQHEDSIFNYPAKGPGPLPFDESFFRDDDLIVLGGRPPMQDSKIREKKHIKRSFSALEAKLFSVPLSKYFERCARSEILMTDEAAAISPAIAARQSMIFWQHGGAGYQSYGSPITDDWKTFKRGEPSTAAFLVYAEHAWPGGPAFLCAFGVGGRETLGWCYLLKTRFRHLLCTTSFAMAELRPQPNKRTDRLSQVVDGWGVDILGTAEVGTDRPKRAA